MTNWLKSKKVTASFSIISLVAGFLFLNNSITGSTILSNQTSISLVSLIGLILIICSLIMASYTIKKR